jgi:membrane protease YdiL (CAAX protease family)
MNRTGDVVAPENARRRRVFARVFVGDDGLRAGWSALLFFIAGFAYLVAIKALFDTHSGLRTDAFRLDTFFLREVLLAGGTILLTWIMSKVEGRPFKVYGFGGRQPLRHFGAGVLWGVACVSALVFTLRLLGLLTFTSLALHGTDVIRYAVEWGVVFILAGVYEEALFHGFFLYTLTRGLSQLYARVCSDATSRRLGFWTASAFIGGLFLVAHTTHPGDSPIGLLAAFVASLAFTVSIWRTGSMWWIIGLHSAWDWSQSFVYGVGDSGVFFDHRLTTSSPAGPVVLSGGLTGPEGSLFVLPALLIVALISVITLPGGGYKNELPK